jgi:hypothetical protein
MFGLKSPLPTTMNPMAKISAARDSTVMMRWPAAMTHPPMSTARLSPSTRSASSPPKGGVR